MSDFGDFLKSDAGKGLLTSAAGSLIATVGSKERAKQYENEGARLSNERARIKAQQNALRGRLANKRSTGISGGAIAGIVIGGLLLTTLLTILIIKSTK